MKIGIFTECYKPILNGVVNSIDGFRKGLTELGHEVYVFCPNYKEKIDEKNIIYCKSFPLPGKSGYHYIYPLDNRKINIAKNLDIIHTQHPFIMASRAYDISKRFNIPLVFTNHTQYEQYAHYAPFGKGFVRYFLKKWVTKFVNKCDLVIAPASGIENKLKEYKVNTEITVVPNGIDLKKFEHKNRNYLKDKYHIKDWHIFIFVGRIAKEKNLEFLIKCFKKIFEKNSECYLFLVGGGPEEENYNNLIKNEGLAKNVFITGYLPYNEIPDCLASSNIFVSASKTEVHPLTVLEAMASNLPSIVFDTVGTGEIIENNTTGLKTKVDNSNEFVNAMENLLKNSEITKKLGINAKEFSKKYSLLETSKMMLEAYGKATKNHNNKEKK